MPARARRHGGGRRVALAAALVAGLVAAAAQATSPNQSTAPPAPGSVANYPTLPLPVPGTKKCTCDDLKKHLDNVEKKEKCYEKAYEHHRTMDNPWELNKADHVKLNEYVQDCMGWTNVYNIGSAGANAGETKQEQQEREKTARQKCDKTQSCEWICRVSVWTVHEPGHTWYDQQPKVDNLTYSLNFWVGRGSVILMRDFIKREIAGHHSEIQFLKETLEEMERKGGCDHVRRTIDQKELDELWKLGLRRANEYVDSLP